jgi:uncharacterized protein YuzE
MEYRLSNAIAMKIGKTPASRLLLKSPFRLPLKAKAISFPHPTLFFMKVIYDPDKDILQIAFIEMTVEETAQITPGLILDYDVDGNFIGLEIAEASTKVDNPYAIAYLVGAANVDKPQPQERERD